MAAEEEEEGATTKSVNPEAPKAELEGREGEGGALFLLLPKYDLIKAS